jgi:hypothetical protein
MKGGEVKKMKHKTLNKAGNKALLIFMVMLLSLSMFACASMDPRNVDVHLETTPPREKITSYTESLSNLGLMTEIYGTEKILIQSNPIGDRTGSSKATGGEIPRDITEMMKSSLNSVGGNVVYIPYDPAFIQNQMVTGYSNFQEKLIPNVVLSGGITEFDRGLATKSENTDFSLGYEFKDLSDDFPSKDVDFRIGDAAKRGLARITLDFNLLDFRTMSGLSKMTAVNTMEVHKAVNEKELAISILGPTFGLKGNIKKVQGRHAAVRLLVELSTIQIVGKYLVVPYWRVLGEDAEDDKTVRDMITAFYYSQDEAGRVSNVKTWLYLYGYDVPLLGGMDSVTQQALQQVDNSYRPEGNKISVETFTKVYTNIPITQKALGRRKMLASAYKKQKETAELSHRYSQNPRQSQNREISAQSKRGTSETERGQFRVLDPDELIDILNELSP